MKNRFPIYVISKGRYKRRPTANALEQMGADYFIIVESQEAEKYRAVVKGEVLVLPQSFKDEYDRFWDDDDPRTGPGPARNFAWHHSMVSGYSHHWVMDDNIEAIERYNNNMKIRCLAPTPFYVMEDFSLRYSNVAISGPNYSNFCPASEGRRPLYFNTRIYSTLLIRNDIPYRWRGRYNEDTDLSLRALKDGWCTVQFNTFLQGKRATSTVRGGNSEEFYDREGTKPKSQMLVDMHPDVSKVIFQYGRWHHHVDYRRFATNILVRDEKIIVPSGINNFGLRLRHAINPTPTGDKKKVMG
jgi:hypothetical protein